MRANSDFLVRDGKRVGFEMMFGVTKILCVSLSWLSIP